MSNTKKKLKQLFALGAVSVHCSAVSSSLEEKEITDHRLSNMEENCHAAEKWPAKLKVGEIRSVGQNLTQPEREASPVLQGKAYVSRLDGHTSARLKITSDKFVTSMPCISLLLKLELPEQWCFYF